MKVTIVWDLDDDEQGNVQHIAQHGIEPWPNKSRAIAS